MSSTLTLICPGMALPLAQAMAAPEQPAGLLAMLAGRGDVSERAIDPRLPEEQAAMLDILGLGAATELRSAAAVMRAASCEPPGFWMRLEPVHMVAGLDRVNITTLTPEAQLSADEHAELQPLLDEYLAELALEPHATHAHGWLVSSERSLDVHCVTPEYAAMQPNAQVLPTGADAGALRRLMTELQMLLHEHPLNQRRQRRGLPQVNALWFHGEGALGAVSRRGLICACGADEYLRGIYRLHDQQVLPLPDAGSLLAGLQGDALAVLDITQWQALEDAWLTPASAALKRGRINQLRLILGRWQVQVSRAAMLKFWRGPRPPAQWVV